MSEIEERMETELGYDDFIVIFVGETITKLSVHLYFGVKNDDSI